MRRTAALQTSYAGWSNASPQMRSASTGLWPLPPTTESPARVRLRIPSSISRSARNTPRRLRMKTQNRIRVLAITLRRILTSVHSAPIVVTGEEDVPPAQRRCVRQNECRLGIRSETLKVQNFPFLEGTPM